jgi:hypothetical protein
MASALRSRQHLSQDPRHGLGGPLRSGRARQARRSKAWSKGSETKVEPLCQFCVSWHVLSWSVPAELAEMAETGGRAKTRVYADFKGLSREDGWCCQTGLNCRPLHYQWSALPLSYGSVPGNYGIGQMAPTGVPVLATRAVLAQARGGRQNGQKSAGCAPCLLQFDRPGGDGFPISAVE